MRLDRLERPVQAACGERGEDQRREQTERAAGEHCVLLRGRSVVVREARRRSDEVIVGWESPRAICNKKEKIFRNGARNTAPSSILKAQKNGGPVAGPAASSPTCCGDYCSSVQVMNWVAPGSALPWPTKRIRRRSVSGHFATRSALPTI